MECPYHIDSFLPVSRMECMKTLRVAKIKVRTPELGREHGSGWSGRRAVVSYGDEELQGDVGAASHLLPKDDAVSGASVVSCLRSR